MDDIGPSCKHYTGDFVTSVDTEENNAEENEDTATSGQNASLSQIQNHVKELPDQLLLLYRAVESTRNGIVITDPNRPDNPIIYCNPAFAELSGFRIDQVIGRNCRFLQRDDRDQPEIAEIRRAIEEGKPIRTTLRNYRKNGQVFWNELTVSPVHDSSGKIINFVGVQNDVSARKEAERRVSEFYSVISHELRTPLTSINGALRVIEDGSAGRVSASVMKMVKIALSNSDRLMRLISDILDLKKIEAGKFKLNLQILPPVTVIDTVIEALKPLADENKISLVKEVHTSQSLIFDPDRVVQILSNLTTNAIKYSPPGGQVLIKVEKPSSDSTRFSVIDHGPGIPQADLEKLFGRFQQIDSSDKRPKGGTGLGLFISKSLVELHGGHIGVESSPGSGSTFWFEFFN
ncbi:MAG: PAS domain-containing protein [Cyanobacteria bacterium SZAS LIN-5]|nr:PAS domain-containing protein [Cyanobacteria bacterium SZAS LIN-5]